MFTTDLKNNNLNKPRVDVFVFWATLNGAIPFKVVLILI